MELITTGDRVKVNEHGGIYKGHIGEVTGTSAYVVWAVLPSTLGNSISFPREQVIKLKHPEKGDRVRVLQPGRWQAHEGTVESVYGKVVNVLLDADQSATARLHVKEVEVFDPAPKVHRVEGEQIAYKDVKVGDLIETLSFTEKSGVKRKIYAEGIVDAISLRNNQLRSRKGVVLYDAEHHTGIKLLQSADNDPVLTSLNVYEVGTILSFYKEGLVATHKLHVAVKKSEGHWAVLGQGYELVRTETLRDNLKGADDTYTVLQNGAEN